MQTNLTSFSELEKEFLSPVKLNSDELNLMIELNSPSPEALSVKLTSLLSTASTDDELKSVDILLKNGALADADFSGNLSVLSENRNGKQDILFNKLIDNGFDPKINNVTKLNGCIKMIQNNNLPLVNAVISANQNTPKDELYLIKQVVEAAAYHGNPQILEAILDSNICGELNEALAIATEDMNPNIIPVLLNKSTNEEIIHALDTCAFNYEFDNLKELITNYNVPINTESNKLLETLITRDPPLDIMKTVISNLDNPISVLKNKELIKELARKPELLGELNQSINKSRVKESVNDSRNQKTVNKNQGISL